MRADGGVASVGRTVACGEEGRCRRRHRRIWRCCDAATAPLLWPAATSACGRCGARRGVWTPGDVAAAGCPEGSSPPSGRAAPCEVGTASVAPHRRRRAAASAESRATRPALASTARMFGRPLWRPSPARTRSRAIRESPTRCRTADALHRRAMRHRRRGRTCQATGAAPSSTRTPASSCPGRASHAV